MEPRTEAGRVLSLFLNTSAGLSEMGQFVADVETEARAAERQDWQEAARRNHGERGHNFPWAECKREVCTWVRFLLDEPTDAP